MVFFTKIYLRLIRLNNSFIFGSGALFILFSSWMAYRIEPDTFGSPFNAFWWVMTTVTTVGYGDYFPHTVPGKWLGIFLYLFGIGMISVTISKVVDALFLYQRKKEAGKLKFTGKGHFVIVDWSKHAELAIHEILNTDPEAVVVLIDNLDKTPIVHHRVHYIQGNPVEEATLELANLSEARAVFIFSNEITEFGTVLRDHSFIDGKTLLIATAIERKYGSVYTIAEIKDERNRDNFRHVKVDEFISGGEAVSYMAVRSAFNPGASALVSQLLSRRNGEDLYEIKKKPQWSTYRDAFEDLLRSGATLLSDGHRMDINRRLDEPLPDHARLFVICDKETYERLAKDEVRPYGP